MDHEGIHETRRGRAHGTILWEDLQKVEMQTIRSTHGVTFRIVLSQKLRAEFRALVSSEWRGRYPERERANEHRCWRQADRAVYFYMPLLLLGPIALLRGMIWFFDRPELTEHFLPKAQRLTITAVPWTLLFLGVATWNRRKRRKETGDGKS